MNLKQEHFDRAMLGLYHYLHHWKETLMATVEDLNTVITSLTAAADAERAQVADGLAKITDLLAQLAAVVPTDLAPQVAAIQAVTDSLVADDPAPVVTV
jgi:ethanolamine utilization protein EutP (predicted NTPase)